MTKPNYREVLVSTTQFRRLVQKGAICSKCGMGVNTHGGYVPCSGGKLIAKVLQNK